MANKTITDLGAFTPPYTGGEVGVIDNGATTYQADLRYLGLADVTITYNGDGTVNTLVKAGRTKSFTYALGALQYCDDTVRRATFGYDANDQIDSITIT